MLQRPALNQERAALKKEGAALKVERAAPKPEGGTLMRLSLRRSVKEMLMMLPTRTVSLNLDCLMRTMRKTMMMMSSTPTTLDVRTRQVMTMRQMMKIQEKVCKQTS